MRPPTVLRPVRNLGLRLHAYPAVTIDGVDAPLRLKRGVALLALLAELSRKVSRAGGRPLWPDADESLGRSRLRRLVDEVHAQCGAELVSADADALWIDATRWAVSSDVQRVRAAAQAFLGETGAGMPDPAALLAPDAAALLDGFDVESDAYAEWLAQRRAEHRRLLSRALQRLAERHAARGDAAMKRYFFGWNSAAPICHSKNA